MGVFIIDTAAADEIRFSLYPLEAEAVHIALYSPNWPPEGAANGIVSYVSTIRDHFIGKGHRVSVLSDGRLYTSDNRAIRLLPPMEQLGALERLKRRLARRADCLHGALPGMGRMLAAQLRAAHRIEPIDIVEMEESFGWSQTVQRLTRIPVITRLHGPFFLKPAKPRTPREHRSDLQRCASEGRAFRASRTLTAPTHAIMNVTCENYGRQLADRDAVIPNPISLAPESDRWSLAACDPNHILMIGRFDFWKGADTMLLAFDRLLQTHPQARLTLVGPKIGIETGPGQLADFEEFARTRLSPATAARVELTGTLTPFEIARLRQRAFVTVLASRMENFPYALLEGLAAGCPMLSTGWAGSDEIIGDGKTGFITPVGDPDAMAQRLAWLLDNPEMAAETGAAGLRHCAETFSIERVGEQLLQCHEATLKAGA